MLKVRLLTLCALLVLSITNVVSADAQAASTAVLTGQYGNGRTAANLNEPVLNTSNVNAGGFGKIGSYVLDGLVFAQPLYVPGVRVGNKEINLLYVATMHNSVYALNADDVTRPPIWHVNLGLSVPAGWAGTCPDVSYTGSELGILGTPVIDSNSNTLYAVSATPNLSASGYLHRLFALDTRTGAAKFGGSVVISAAVKGSGTESQNGIVQMNENKMIQRPALLLSQGAVYAGFGGCGPDPSPYHGWLIGYSAANVRSQVAVFNVTTDADMGAVWQSGRGPVADSRGSVYFMTGNSPQSDDSDFGESFVKLSSRGALSDWFTPPDKPELDAYDLDLGSSGPILTPDSKLLVGGGKEGVIYVLNPNALGQSKSPLQSFQGTAFCGTFTFSGCQQIHYPAYWARAESWTPRGNESLGPLLYVWGWNDTLRAYRFSGEAFNTTPDSEGGLLAPFPGGNLTVSASSSQATTAVLWAKVSSTLHAYDARNVEKELWNSAQNVLRDGLGPTLPLALFTVANGKVYVPVSSNAIVVYGLLTRRGFNN